MTQNLTNKTGSGPDRYREEGHTPVLVDETLRLLDLQPGMTVVDATLGAGWMSQAILSRIGEGGRLISIDRDPQMIALARERFAGSPNVALYQSGFSNIDDVLSRDGQSEVDAIVFDLGLNSLQLADPSRGFSFRESGPLDMRFSPEQKVTAADIVNKAEEIALADLIYRYGEERRSRRIAHAIVVSRPIHDTGRLAEVIERVVPRSGRIHPATRTFQALRITVNDELGELQTALQKSAELLRADGRLAVISFHSLEDRIVKQFLSEGERKGEWSRLTKKPVTPSSEEVVRNPRSRSAKLRAAVRTHTQ